MLNRLKSMRPKSNRPRPLQPLRWRFVSGVLQSNLESCLNPIFHTTDFGICGARACARRKAMQSRGRRRILFFDKPFCSKLTKPRTKGKSMKHKLHIKWVGTLCAAFVAIAQAADKPNILFIVSDDTGYGDLGPYGGGEGRGMPTPNIDRLAAEGMTFFSYYAQPSCTPGRAAMI